MNFNELIDIYTKRLDVYMREINNLSASRNIKQKKSIPPSPSYLEEVIIPIYQSLANYMVPKIKIPDPKTYHPIKDYYRIKVGVTTVGGFSVPDGEDFFIYFTPLKHAIPSGKKVKVENTEQLAQLIQTQLQIIKQL